MSSTPSERGRSLTQAFAHVAAANDELHKIDLRACPKEVKESVKEARNLAATLTDEMQNAIQHHLEAQRETA